MKSDAVGSEVQAVVEPKVGPGPGLREAREARNFTQDAVAKQLRIDVSLVRALEEDDYGKFAAPIFVTGHLRAYARLLGLPPESLIESYRNLGTAAAPSLERVAHLSNQPEPIETAQVPRWVAYVMVTAAVAAVIIIWRAEVTRLLAPIMESPLMPQMLQSGASDNGTKSAQQSTDDGDLRQTLALPVSPGGESNPLASENNTSAAPAVQPQTPPPDLPQAHLLIKAEKPSWVEVKDGTGKRLFYDLMVPGDAQTLEGVPPFDVLLGYAPGITIEYNGKRVDPTIYARQEMARFRVGDEGAGKN